MLDVDVPVVTASPVTGTFLSASRRQLSTNSSIDSANEVNTESSASDTAADIGKGAIADAMFRDTNTMHEE